MQSAILIRSLKMNLFISLKINKAMPYFWTLLLVLYSFPVFSVEKPDVTTTPINDYFDMSKYKQSWMDNVQIHGFFSQALFSSSGNHIYGKSRNSVSAGLTELGLNISYQPFNALSFSAQGLYRRAGAINPSSVRLDYAFADYAFFRYKQGQMGMRGGRVKNPWGFYNELRDVAFTYPTILLPLLYFERSRNLYLAMDGGQFYANYSANFGTIGFKINYGLMDVKDPELLKVISPSAEGHLASRPDLVTQLTYETQDGGYRFAISYADVIMRYQTAGGTDPVFTGDPVIKSLMFSGQYNHEKFSFTGEYALQWNILTNFTGVNGIIPDRRHAPQHWYVQAEYRFLDNLQGTVRYDSTLENLSDKVGKKFHAATGLPAALMFTQDIVVGLRWDITHFWMLRAEYHRMHGASTVSLLENSDILNLATDWNIYALQMSYRF